MKTKLLLLSGLVALLASVSAHAQIAGVDVNNLANNSQGDVVLGARANGKDDLVIDLGTLADFKSVAAGTTVALNAINYADFTNTFGSTAATWTVFGGTGASATFAPKATLFLSSPFVGSSYAGKLADANQLVTSNQLAAYSNTMGGTAGLTASSFTDSTHAFTNLINYSSPFNYKPGAVEQTVADGSKVELFELIGTTSGTAAALDLGTITLSSAGSTFTAFAAIPEPSTYAALLGVATLGFAAIRRRKQAQLLA